MENESEFVEIKSSIGQKLLITMLFLFMGCYVGVGFMLAPILPEFVGAADDIAKGSALTKITVFVGGAAFFLFFFYLWWVTTFYFLRADSHGISTKNGFSNNFVRWQDVASYTMETNPKWYKERRRHVEPVLRNAKGEVIFRAPAHILTSSKGVFQSRSRFWQFVQKQL